MTTVIELRLRRKEADAACARPTAAAFSGKPADAPARPDAEIILMPLTWLKQLGRSRPRKPLKRRFAMRETAPA
jgi:hypothetical protein